MKKLLYIYILFVFCACEKIVTDVALPKTEQQMVMHAFLSPEDSVINVYVSLSSPVFNNPNSVPIINPNAKVTISDVNGVTKSLIFNALKGSFTLAQKEFQLKGGQTYTVKASWNNYNLIGTTTIPYNIVNIDTLNYIRVVASPNSNLPSLKINTKWTDNAETKNYYRVVSYGLFNQSIITLLCNNSMYSDAGKEGAKFNALCDYYSYDESPQSEFTHLKSYLINSDKAYYEYHIRRLNYFGEDPFSEPFQMYNNVSGGLGCVASYRMSEITIPVN